MPSFAELNLSPEILQSLTRLKYETPTPVQQLAIPFALAGRDIIASAQTGTGKTAAFGIPLITKLIAAPGTSALVLAPTRELAGQIVVALRDLAAGSRDIDVTLLIGGVNIENQRRALRRSPRIIVATPGRLVDLLRGIKVLLEKTTFLVLDEADRMLDLGFAPQLEIIRKALPAERQTMLFSATYPSDIAHLAQKWLKNPERVAVGAVTKPVERIAQSMIEVTGDQKNDTVLAELSSRTGSVLVFARTKRRTDKLAAFLHNKGIEVCRIHGDRSQHQREDALMGFRKGKFRVLVATDIAARGIDIPHIEHVINYDLPFVPEDYLHRIGRTARAGREGKALCLVAPEERSLWRAIQRLLGTPDGLSSTSKERVSPRGMGGRGGSSGGGSRGGSRFGNRGRDGRSQGGNHGGESRGGGGQGRSGNGSSRGGFSRGNSSRGNSRGRSSEGTRDGGGFGR
jgi:ATP-dependent RNA helicase DeaD